MAELLVVPAAYVIVDDVLTVLGRAYRAIKAAWKGEPQPPEPSRRLPSERP